MMKRMSLFALPALVAARTGPAHLEDVCATINGEEVCHRFGKIRGPLDHEDPSAGEHDIVYFVNSDYWDPASKPNGPVFINIAYGSTGNGYTAGYLRQVDDSFFPRGMPGATPELAEELGALIINVPNRYYGCSAARTEQTGAACPVSLDDIPEGEAGQREAHERLKYLSLTQVVDDLAFVARETLSTYAADWGMPRSGSERFAPNKPIVFGCSWPGAAAVYARMRHPELFPGAVATSMPLVSSPVGNNHYRSFVGHVYELYSAGGSLECRNILSVGHEEIRRLIETEGEDVTPAGSCVKDCYISQNVNRDFGLSDTRYWSFGGGIPGLPGVQSINRDCTTLGCNIESTCGFIVDCFDEAIDATFPISASDPLAAQTAYNCLAAFSDARAKAVAASKEEEKDVEIESLIYDPERLSPANNLGPRVFDSTTLTYQMFGFKGPLWMTQTCNDDSECPFVKGAFGGASFDQINARLYSSYGKPEQSLEDFNLMMKEEALEWQERMGGQSPWKASETANNIYMVYNDADPWTGTGARLNFPNDRNLEYDLGGGGIAHCVWPAPGAQDWIRQWAQPTEVSAKE